MDFFFFHSTNILTQTLSHYQNMKKIAKVQTMCHNYFCQKFHCIYFFLLIYKMKEITKCN